MSQEPLKKLDGQEVFGKHFGPQEYLKISNGENYSSTETFNNKKPKDIIVEPGSIPDLTKEFDRKNMIHDNDYSKNNTDKIDKHSCEYFLYYTTNHKSTLDKHVKSIHDGVKHLCQLCDYKASQRSSLQRHVKSIHIRQLQKTSFNDM